MLVQVTSSHIRRGELGDSSACPIALALQDMGYTDVSVGDLIYLSKGVQQWRYRTPAIARRFIEPFDCEKTVEPFAFILDTPLTDRRRRT